VDWLINRRHCNQEWPSVGVVIRDKINTAIEDMPPVQEITKLLEGTYINYFHCKKIVELLKDTDSGKKNMFGQYSSQKMKDWVEVIKLYEKDGTYLAETAQMMARNVNYEVPALKKQIAKCQQTQKDCERKETDYATQSTELRKKYDASCKQMGIEGKKIKSELLALVTDLPKEFTRIAESAKCLQPGITYYNDFVKFMFGSEESESLSMMTYLLQNGNTTTYQWRTGDKPEVVEEAKIFIDITDEQDATENPDDIDWGDPGAFTESGVDFGDEIDFNMADITIETGGMEGEVTQEGSHDSDSNGVDWNEVVIVDKPSSEEGVAKGEDALSILDNPRTRTLFIDDIMELEAFLRQRLTELEADLQGDVISSSQFQSAPSSVQIDSEAVRGMLTNVKDVLDQLTSVKMQHLMLIRNSPRYVDRLKESLKQTLTLADKMIFLEKEMVVKHKKAVEEQGELEPKLDVIIKRTKEMQQQMEEEISKKYKERRVNIMGDINMI
ncbi:hypothetical protein FSP39_010044, partial [Pinctada imbricata]